MTSTDKDHDKIETLNEEDETENAQSGNTGTESKDDSGGIEGEEMDNTEQIVYMVQNLSTRDRRRTLMKLRPMIDPLLSSTLLDASDAEVNVGDITSPDKPTSSKVTDSKVSDSKVTDTSVLYTSSGEVTLATGTSRVVIQSGGYVNKLRQFSGKTPVPNGECDFLTWYAAASRIQKNKEMPEHEKIQRIQNSLSKPALETAQQTLEVGSSAQVLSLLQKVYDNVEDPKDLLNKFNNTVQGSVDSKECKETASEYLSRLYLLINTLIRRGAVDVDDVSSTLLKQFIYGCNDENLLLKLRLEEKELNPPDYGTLLLAIRKEEAKRTRRQMTSRMARSNQVQVSETSELEALKREIISLKEQLHTAGQKSQPDKLETMRREISQLKQQQQRGSDNLHQQKPHTDTASTGKKASASQTKPRLRFCFKCGLNGHLIWSCSNEANSKLVAQRFEEAKKEGNAQGSK